MAIAIAPPRAFAATPGIAFRASSTGSTAASATSLSLAKPAGTVAGDVLIARVANRNVVTTTMSASGWTQVGATASAGLLKSFVWVKVAGSAEPASYAFTLNQAAPMAGSVSAFSGVDLTDPVDAFAGKVNGNSASFTGTAVTAGAADELGLWFGTQLWSSAPCPVASITQPSGFTEPTESCGVTGTNEGLLYDVAYRQLGAAGAQSAWSGSSPYPNTNVVQSLTLRPAGAPTAGAIAHRATTSAGVASGTSLVIGRPAGTVAGDVMLARVTNRNSVTATMTPPAGWTQVRVDQTTYSLKAWILVKVATANEPASYPFTFGSALAIAGSISSFTGADTGQPVETSSGKYNSASTTFGTPALTTATGQGLGVWFGTQAADYTCPTGVITQPAGFAEPLDTCLGGTGQGIAYDVATLSLGAAGAQPAWTGSSTTAATNLTQAVALRRAGTPAPDTVYASSPVTVGQVWDGFSTGTTRNTAIPLTELDQPSGLAWSAVNPNVLYVHSEKDRQTMLAISATDARVLGKFTVTIPNVFDWEDIAVGPCPAGSCLYAGDIGTSRGDLSKPNNVMSVVRVREPDLNVTTSGTLTGDYFPFVYGTGTTRFNSEALMVDRGTRDIYVITKNTTGSSDVYRYPNPLPAPGTQSSLAKVATLTLPLLGSDTASVEITAAAVHPTGNRFLIRTYRAVYEFRGTDGGSFDSALGAPPVAVTDTAEGQGESIEYRGDGSAYFTLSERDSPPYSLKRVDKR